VKGEVENNPVFQTETGFFIGILNMAGSLTLKIAASLSLGIHLLFLGIASSLFQNPKGLRMPGRYVTVTLLPLVTDEKPNARIIPPVPLKVGNHNLGEPIFDPKIPTLDSPFPSKSTSTNIPLEEPKTIPQQREEDRTVKEPLDVAMAVEPPSDTNLTKGTGTVSSKEAAASGGNFSLSLPAFRSGGFDAGTFSYSSSGDGNGSGAGSESRSSSRGAPGKGEGIWGKIFSSRAGGNGARPRYAENPKPLYPEEAKKKRYEGEVVLRVEVLISGRVGQIEIKKSSGYELLDRSALTAVRQWRFLPAKKDEVPIPLWVNIPIKFQLQ
jgi:TonB family protein